MTFVEQNTTLLLYLQLKLQETVFLIIKNIQYLPQLIFGEKFIMFSEQIKAFSHEVTFPYLLVTSVVSNTGTHCSKAGCAGGARVDHGAHPPFTE